MILWSIKLLSSVRKAIAGRRNPGQLAWAIALGLCLGLIPHGNLLAVIVLAVILSLQINHAMAALVTIGVTFAANKLDPISERVGFQVLSNPEVANFMARAWDWPLVAWTDLNNTVVMGSFLIGVALMLPVVALTYPFLKWWADRADRVELMAEGRQAEASSRSDEEDRAVLHQAHLGVAGTPHQAGVSRSQVQLEGTSDSAPGSSRLLDVRRVDSAHSSISGSPQRRTGSPGSNGSPAGGDGDGIQTGQPTRVEIGRSSAPPPSSAAEEEASPTAARPHRPFVSPSAPIVSPSEPTGGAADDQTKIDEALRYLLRQLRNSQEKDAA